MATDKKATRRQYSAGLKAQVLGECEASGASVAKVAMSHGINANIVHSWRQLAREAGQSSAAATTAPVQTQAQAKAHTQIQTQAQFLPVMMAAATHPARSTETPSSIEVELRRGAVTMRLTWPVCALADFAAWTRMVLA